MPTSNIHSTKPTIDSDQSDAQLVERIREGEAALYAIVMRRHNRLLYRLARAVLRDDAEAEDVVQHAYITGFRKLDQFRGHAQLSTWLSRITVNEALARAKKRARHGELMLAGEPHLALSRGPNPEDEAAWRELGRTLEQYVDALPSTLRVVFVMREVEELGTAQVAELLEISEQAVRVRLHRARQLLQRRLAQIVEHAPETFPFAGTRCDRIVQQVLASLDIAPAAR